MRFRIRFQPDRELILPLNYQQIIQGLIYRVMADREFATFLHEQGFHYEKRAFRLFTFSRLQGNYRIDKVQKKIVFNGEIVLRISSIVPKFIQELGRSLLQQGEVLLDGQSVPIKEISYEPLPVLGAPCKINMISPITIYSTYDSHDGRKITQFFDPDDAVFPHLIADNMRKKFEAYYERPAPGELSIRPLQVGKRDKIVTSFKGFMITGWNGIYELRGDPEMLQFAYAVGIGGRNSQGFGMFELV
jgi:CRISPR-associated endoribonuclease Cas6